MCTHWNVELKFWGIIFSAKFLVMMIVFLYLYDFPSDAIALDDVLTQRQHLYSNLGSDVTAPKQSGWSTSSLFAPPT